MAPRLMLFNRFAVNLSKLVKVFFLLGLIFFVKVGYSEQSLTMLIDSSEGGENSDKRTHQLRMYLISKECNVQTIKFEDEHQSNSKYDLVFKPIQKNLSHDYRQQLSIKVIAGTPLSASIVVRKSTAIKSLENLSNIHIAFLSEESELGYRLPIELLNQSGVTFTKHNITFAQSNLAAVSLLMHKDVFAAVIATPLARRWEKTNDLLIVSKTRELIPGGIWFRKKLSDQNIKLCGNAFSSLNQSDRHGKKLLSIFPGWIESFVTFSNEAHSKQPLKN